jgi:hypothetical protein
MPDIATTDGKLKVSPGIDFLRQTRYKAPSHFSEANTRRKE